MFKLYLELFILSVLLKQFTFTVLSIDFVNSSLIYLDSIEVLPTIPLLIESTFSQDNYFIIISHHDNNLLNDKLNKILIIRSSSHS